jgi:hypothetical protein
MRKVLRGYAKVKDGNLILIGTIPVPHSKDKPSRGSEMNVKRHQNQHFIRTNKQQRTTFLSGEWKRPIHEKKRNHFGGPAHGEADACR